ncbi:MAG: hypothetical protein IPN79_00965 [Saprospiraceae bacterium]|nr:hypothetical protein [Saprospiraceae bacterium]
MNKYLLLLHEQIDVIQNLSPKEMEELVSSHMAWANKLESDGLLLAGDGLEDKGVQISGKESIVKDSMFLETKEMIGGFYLIQAGSFEEAVEISKSCPCHQWGGVTEVRPIANYASE